MSIFEMKIRKWDAAEHLDNNETIAAYLSDVMESGDQKHIVHALNTVARARGITQIAQDADIKLIKPDPTPVIASIAKQSSGSSK
jgi:DNA-binding phage protein